MKKVLAIILASIFGLSFAGCNGNSNSAKVEDTTASATSTTVAASTSPISNENSEYIVINSSNTISVCKNSTSDKFDTICKIDAANHTKYHPQLIKAKSDIYFTFLDSKDGLKRELYKIDDDKSEYISSFKMIQEPLSFSQYSIYFANDNIYYCDGVQIFKTDLTGKSKSVIIKPLKDGESHYSLDFTISNNKIFYSFYDKGLFVSDLNGSNSKSISTKSYSSFSVLNNNVFGLSENNDEFKCNLCEISQDKINILIKDVHFFSYFATEDSIYYTVQDDSKDGVSGNTSRLYKYDYNGQNSKIIYQNNSVNNLSVSTVKGDKIILTCSAENDSQTTFSISLDGTGYKKLS